jgi:hypothetical protein
MCAAIQPHEAAAAASAGPGAEAGDELRATVTAVASPVAGVVSVRYSGDLLWLARTAGRVTGSTRLPAHQTLPLVRRRYQEAVEAVSAVRTTCEGLTADGPLRPQSALVTVGTRLRVLARLETPAGPMLAGGAGTAAVADMLEVVAELSRLPGALADAPRGWDRRPLLLRPPVAAVLLAGVRLVLGGAAAGRLAGRRVLPDLTLVDRPVEHAEGALDDCGTPAEAHMLVRSGRVAPLPPDTCPGVPPGRAVWCHEESRPVIAATFGLTLSGMPAVSPPDGAVELLACAEGLRRYHADGHLQMTCLARSADSASIFLVAVRARPLSMLRAVTGLAGGSANTYLEDEIDTPSLVLLSADELARKCHVLLSSL